MTEVEMLEKIWFIYPSDLCKNKRGGRPPALAAIKKRKFTESTFNKFMLDLAAHTKSDRSDPDAYRWPFLSTYINQCREQDTVIAIDKPKQVLSSCQQEGCKNDVHGPNFNHCVFHLPQPPSLVLDKMRQKYADLGLIKRKDETKQEHLDRCKVIYNQGLKAIL